MANIVEAQGELIDSVAAQAESSHGQAKEGLEQVKQAAKYQSSCLLS